MQHSPVQCHSHCAANITKIKSEPKISRNNIVKQNKKINQTTRSEPNQALDTYSNTCEIISVDMRLGHSRSLDVV